MDVELVLARRFRDFLGKIIADWNLGDIAFAGCRARHAGIYAFDF
jgi:hypothetical protein